MNRNLALLGQILGHLLFWGWNSLLLLVVAVGFGPVVLWEMLVATARGFVPWHVAAFGIAILALPVASMALGLWKLRRDPGRLLSLLYGVQAPLMLLCTVRLFAVQALTPATGLFLAVVAFGTAGLLRTLLVGSEERTATPQLLRQGSASANLLVGLWWGALVALYTFPMILLLSRELVVEVLLEPAAWRELLRELATAPDFIPLALLWVGFAAVTAMNALVFPVAMLGISARAWQLVNRATVRRAGIPAAATVTGLTVGGLLLGFGLAARQPQAAAFAVVEEATTDAARRAALERSDVVRDGLVNARLAAIRHLDGDPEGEHVVHLWKEVVGETLAGAPQLAWRALTFPFLYHPVHEGRARHGRRWVSEPLDRSEAEAAYARFFDAPMAVGERETLLAAERQTWSWEAAEASLLEVGQRKVRLDRQDIRVDRHGDVAVVTVHDVYRNQTWLDEEIRLGFALPDGAVPTGLWLGHTADRDEAFPYVVAPRGAAQEVYESEVRRQVDPALLEQVGPRQYRLRAFPVPAREGDPGDVWDLGSEGPELHLWLELVVGLDEAEPRFPLPELTEVRNLFWDERTVRTLDGEPVLAEGWTPRSVPAVGATRGHHSADLGRWRVTAAPAGPVTPARKERVAVLVDGTRSMEALRTELSDALARLEDAADEVVVLCTVEQALRRCDGYDPAAALFWGAVALEERLVEAASLLDGADALVVLTDAGSYELAAEAEARGLPDVGLPPLWLVHLGGTPVAYPDWTADRLQRSGGGAVSTIDELLVRWTDAAVFGGWRWTVTERTAGSGAPPALDRPADPFGRLAARRLVAHLDQQDGSGALDALDALHAVAVGAEIVTPYSSMIVLVEERQRDLLAEAEGRADRFDREVTTDDEAVEVTAVPEPGTWLLVLLGGGGLVGLRRRREASLARSGGAG